MQVASDTGPAMLPEVSSRSSRMPCPDSGLPVTCDAVRAASKPAQEQRAHQDVGIGCQVSDALMTHEQSTPALCQALPPSHPLAFAASMSCSLAVPSHAGYCVQLQCRRRAHKHACKLTNPMTSAGTLSNLAIRNIPELADCLIQLFQPASNTPPRLAPNAASR